VSDLKQALALVPGHREILRLLARVEDELRASRAHDASRHTTTILPDSVVDTASRSLDIPDIVPGSVCSDVDSFDASEQNDMPAGP